jgi:hypothetical protein
MKNKTFFFILGILLIANLFTISLISAPSFGELKVTEEHPFLDKSGRIIN